MTLRRTRLCTNSTTKHIYFSLLVNNSVFIPHCANQCTQLKQIYPQKDIIMSSRVTRSSAAAAAAVGQNIAQSNAKGKKPASSSKSENVASSSTAIPSSNQEPKVDGPVFFWREYGDQNCYLSQWYASPFHTGDLKGIIYQTAEQ